MSRYAVEQSTSARDADHSGTQLETGLGRSVVGHSGLVGGCDGGSWALDWPRSSSKNGFVLQFESLKQSVAKRNSPNSGAS